MSLTSRILFGVGLALVLLACCVDAHGWMAYPKPRGQYLTPPKPSYMEYAPASRDPDDIANVCRNDPVMPKASWLPLRAGESQSITLQFNARHVGDCFVYLSYDGDKPVNEMKWFKIWEQHACKDAEHYDIPIPAYLPSGDHVVFRWEWYALHVYPIVEYYAQCVDATMTSATGGRPMSGSATTGLPLPQVTMPGHLPHLAGNIMDNTNNYWWPFDDQPMKFTGPALATLNGQPNPTSAPKPTSAPTPTTAPSATPNPTIAPPTAPTTRPTAPTNKPTFSPTESVKLHVLEATSQWWIAAALTGYRSDEVVKVEAKSDTTTNYMPMTMTDDWAGVWVLSPSARGPLALIYPLTVKASLASGSSISFTVNLPATTIDSGARFA